MTELEGIHAEVAQSWSEYIKARFTAGAGAIALHAAGYVGRLVNYEFEGDEDEQHTN